MSVISNNQLAGAAGQGGAAGYRIDRSLRFNDSDSAALDRVFLSEGSRTTWTFSAWVKRSDLGRNGQALFDCRGTSNNNDYLEIRFAPSSSPDSLTLSTALSNYRVSNAVFRDTSAWFHVVWACNTNAAQQSDRIKLYVNGVQQTFQSQAGISQGMTLGVNQALNHRIGRNFDGYLADVHFIDGQALDPTDFGEYDDNNVWQPKEYTHNVPTNDNTGTISATAAGWQSLNNSLDGSTSNKSPSNNNTAGTITFGSQLYGVTRVRAYTRFYGGGTARLYHNGSIVHQTGTINNNNATQWYDIYSGPAITIDQYWQQMSNGSSDDFWALEINGVVVTTSTNGGNLTSTIPVAGANSFHLDFSDNSSNAALGTDSSGNNNNWTVNNISVASGSGNDSLIDTPTNYTAASGNNGGNYATFSPIDSHSSNTFANGNLEATNAGVAVFANLTMGFTSGKWYCEIEANGGGNGSCMVGICDLNKPHANRKYGQTGGLYMYQSTGGLYSGGLGGSFSNTSYGSAYSDGDIIGIGLDMDNGNVRFYINGSDQGQANTSSLAGALVSPAVNNDTNSASFKLNAGQRPFTYTPPTDHLPLVTTSFNNPTIADGSTAMDAVTYAGTNATNTQTLNFGPDLLWFKSRSDALSHQIFDFVRGSTKALFSDSTAGEGTVTDRLTSFNTDGFTLGADAANRVNGTGKTYVGWAWDAGSSNTSISAGSLNSSAYLYGDWTSMVTGNYSSAHGWGTTYQTLNAFDGNLSTMVIPHGSDGWKFEPTTPIAGNKIEIRGWNDGCPNAGLKINGNNYGDALGPDQTVGEWYTLPYSTLESIELAGDGSAGNTEFRLQAIRIDGRLLIQNNQSPPNVPSIASTCRANPLSGFSIVSYSGNSTSGATVAHSLNSKPELIIIKARNTAQGWATYHASVGANKFLQLDTTGAGVSYGGFMNNTEPTTSVFSLGNDNFVNLGWNYVAYCFAPVEGYSAFGSYTGNGSSDGPFVFTGFKVAFLLTKRTDTAENWEIRDTTRNPYNRTNLTLFPHSSGAEDTGSVDFDFLSNGFKVRNTNGAANANGGTYIYAAFAEHPFSLNGGLAR